MKKILSYSICATGLFVAILLVCGGGLWSWCGLLWCVMLYVSGVAFPSLWRSFWLANLRILSRFDCL